MKYKIEFAAHSIKAKLSQTNSTNFMCGGKCLPAQKDSLKEAISSSNSDTFCQMYAVFDPVDKTVDGDICTYIAAKSFGSYKKIFDAKNVTVSLTDLCQLASDNISSFADQNECDLMAASVAFVVYHKKEIYVGNVGNCKVFKFNDGNILKLTTDDNDKRITSGRNVVSKYLGGTKSNYVSPHIRKGKYKTGEVYIICTDSLAEYVDSAAMSYIVTSNGTARDICNAFVDVAKARGCNKDISVIVCK